MRTRTETGIIPYAAGSPSPQRIRWGAVFGGAILGIALLALLTTLWFALAFGSEVDAIRTNLEWYVGISAIVSLFVAGLIAGWLSGVRGAGSGFFNGVTIGALVVLLTLSVGLPAMFNVLNLGRVADLDSSANLLDPSADTVLWATFLSILGGLLASGLGGMIGGAMTRPANAHLYDEALTTRNEVVERPARPDRDEQAVVVPDARRDEEETVQYHQRVP